MDQLFEVSSHTKDQIVSSDANLFGLGAESRDALKCIAMDPSVKSMWSEHPPFRFGVEFWNVDALKECRVHSQTIWYAGNLFNVYVQVIRKNGFQMGIYLHRQSNFVPIPSSSAPCWPISSAETFLGKQRSHLPLSSFTSPTSSFAHSTHYSPSLDAPSRNSTPTYAVGTFMPATVMSVSPIQPYRDPRPSISAYFTMSCLSTFGSSLTKFSSAPDVFNISQSWGWRLSPLMSEEIGDDTDGAGSGECSPRGNPEVSFRATVVLGII